MGQEQLKFMKKVQDYAMEKLLNKAYWTDMSLSKNVRDTIDSENWGAKETFKYDHLANGFKGARFNWTAETRVLTQVQVGQMWADVRTALKTARQTVAMQRDRRA